MMSREISPAEGSLTIRGLLVPADWDEQGNIIGTSVLTYFEEEYFIEQNAKGEALLTFFGKKVKVIGLVRMDDRGRKVVTVEVCEILEA